MVQTGRQTRVLLLNDMERLERTLFRLEQGAVCPLNMQLVFVFILDITYGEWWDYLAHFLPTIISMQYASLQFDLTSFCRDMLQDILPQGLLLLLDAVMEIMTWWLGGLECCFITEWQDGQDTSTLLKRCCFLIHYINLGLLLEGALWCVFCVYWFVHIIEYSSLIWYQYDVLKTCILSYGIVPVIIMVHLDTACIISSVKKKKKTLLLTLGITENALFT